MVAGNLKFWEFFFKSDNKRIVAFFGWAQSIKNWIEAPTSVNAKQNQTFQRYVRTNQKKKGQRESKGIPYNAFMIDPSG